MDQIRELLQYPANLSRQDISAELLQTIDEMIQFVRINPHSIVPYKFTLKYTERQVPTYYDSALEMIYIVENDKKIYFKRGATKEQVLACYNGMAFEQDDLSPHRYLTSELRMMGTLPSDALTSGFTVNKGDVVVDLGVGEGNFSFSVADLVSKLYLFECDPEWVRALEATFRDYNDKVTIVSKYVSDIDDENNISLDTYFGPNSIVNFIKADIEGYERKALLGMRKLLARNTDIRAAICAYHHPADAVDFEEFFRKMGFETSFTKGYLWIPRPPFFRKGVLRATKKALD